MTATTATRVRITCNCKVCKANAVRLGLTGPLAADVPAALLATMGGKRHGLVHVAHDPNRVTGAAARLTLDVLPA